MLTGSSQPPDRPESGETGVGEAVVGEADVPATLGAAVRRRLLWVQLAPHLPEPGRAVDVGCGPGWLSLDLARAGHVVTAVDADPAMVAAVTRRAAADPGATARVRAMHGRLEEVADLPGQGRFDLVCCHAVLPLVVDHRRALRDLAALARPGGVVSIVAKNADGLVLRAALESRWEAAAALAAGTEEHDDRGRVLRAHRPAQVVASLGDAGVDVLGWWGVQVATSHRYEPSAPDEIAAAVALEETLGSRDPERRLARQFHVVGVRRHPRSPASP